MPLNELDKFLFFQSAVFDIASDQKRRNVPRRANQSGHIANRVPMLTGDKQHPGMEVRYDTTLFARNR